MPLNRLAAPRGYGAVSCAWPGGPERDGRHRHLDCQSSV